jgi:uncharacterized membrane protein YfcA
MLTNFIFEGFVVFLLQTFAQLNFLQVLYIAGIILFAFSANSIAGFGSGSISMGFVVQLLAYSQAVFLISVQESVSHTVLIIRNRKDFLWKQVVLIALGAVFGILIGLWLIDSVNTGLLQKFLGVAILLGSARLFFHTERSTKLTLPPVFDILAGVLTGISGSLFNIEGPIIALYLSYRYHNHKILRAQIILVQAMIGFSKVILFGFSDLITSQMVLISILFIPVTVLGSNLGHNLSSKINAKVFKIFLGIILLLASLNLLLTS